MMNKKPNPHVVLCTYLLLLPLFGFAWVGMQAGEIAKTLNELALPPAADTVKKTTLQLPNVNLTIQGNRIIQGDDFHDILLILDGREITADEMRLLDAKDIASISVLKDKAVIDLFGNKDKDKTGAILITTKAGAKREARREPARLRTPQPFAQQTPSVAKTAAFIPKGNILYILDGIPVDEIESIPPEHIQSISVLKDQAAIAVYGNSVKDKAGVIVITTKTNHQEAK